MDFILSATALPLLALTLAAAFFGVLLAERLRFPSAVVLVAVGMAAGLPSLGLDGAVFATASSIGLVFAFFAMGAAIDPGRLAKAGLGAILFSLVRFAAALALGCFGGRTLLGLDGLDGLLLGAALSAAGPFPAGLVKRLGPVRLRDASSLLVANELGELLRLAAFALIFSLRTPVDPEALLPLFGKGGGIAAAALILAALVAGYLGLRLVLPPLLRRLEGSTTLGFVALAAAGAAAAGLARLLGLPGPLPALVAGLALGGFARGASLLEERLTFVSRSLFLPFVLVPGGMAVTALLAGGNLATQAIAALLALAILGIPRFAAALSLLPFVPPAALPTLLGPGSSRPPLPSTLLYVLLVAGAGGFGGLEAGVICALLPTLWLGEALGDREARSQPEGSEPVKRSPRGRGSRTAAGDILLGLANPGTAPGLLALAFLLRPRGSTSTLRPLVVCEEEGGERELERAEKLLAQAMVAARDANAPVAPSTLVASGVAQGLAASLAENPAGLVILGWNGVPRSSFGRSPGVAESLLGLSDSLVALARPASGFEGIERLILAIPPGFEMREEAAKALPALTALLAATGAGLTALGQRPSGASIRGFLGGLRARGGVEIEELESWKLAEKAASLRLRDSAGRRTGLVLLSGRPGTRGWHPSFEHLPRDFARAFPDRPLVVLYPPSAQAESDTGGDSLGLFGLALERGRVIVSMDEAAVTDAIRRLLATAWGGDRKSLGRLTALFTGIALKEAIELEEGVILLHAHVPDIEAPRLFFGSSQRGWKLVALDDPVRVLVILCAPEGQGPERHLATLGELARLFKDGRLGSRLAEATDPSSLTGAGPMEVAAPGEGEGDEPGA